MHLLPALVGISHRTAPVELRERVDFQARGLERALRGARGPRRRRARRSCSRRATAPSSTSRATTSARRAPISSASSATSTASTAPTLAPHVYDVADLEAARHLFRVAAGLDSLVVGEPQILGQVKEAHTAADRRADGRARCSTACSTRRSPSASACGRRPALGVGRRVGQLRGGRAGAEDLRRPRRAATSLVVGAGEMGKLTALHMKSQGVQHVTIVSRTMAHAARTAEAIGGAIGGAVGRAGRRARRERHRHHRDRRGARRS